MGSDRAGDNRILNAIYRNGYLWFAHAVAMPAGSYTHTAARWVKADTSGNFVDGGQVEDPRSDPTGSMRDPYIYKAGEGFYYKIYGGTRNRWGDFSNSQVDPVDDTDLWTIQEYAKPPVCGL